MEKFNTIVNDNLSWVHSNKIIFSLISLILAIYFIQARPKLPTYVEKVFENSVFRFLVISFIVYQSNKDPQLSIMISAAFLITMHMINKNIVENMVYLGNINLIKPPSTCPPTCPPPPPPPCGCPTCPCPTQ